jgi:DNA-binding GntR family transcriptional regulator
VTNLKPLVKEIDPTNFPRTGTSVLGLAASRVAPLERTPSLTERVQERLRESIVEHDLHPGEPLVIEQLAGMLRVSRTPIREALSGLLQSGLIEESASGFRVAPIDAGYVWQVYSLRSVLESLAAEALAPMLTRQDIATLRKEAFPRPITRKPVRDGEAELDGGFHDLVHDFVRSRCPLPYLKTLIEAIRVHHRRLRLLEQRAQPKQSYRDHLAIFEALKSGDGARSRQLMQEHLDRIGREVVALVAEDPPH